MLLISRATLTGEKLYNISIYFLLITYYIGSIYNFNIINRKQKPKSD